MVLHTVVGQVMELHTQARFDRYSDYTWQEGAYDTDWEKIAYRRVYKRR